MLKPTLHSPDGLRGTTERNVAAQERDAVEYERRDLQPPEQMLLGLFRDRWPGISMLDLGVGAGRTAYTFAPLAGRYVGLDLSEEMVRLSRELVGEDETTRFLACDARNLAEEFEGERFDLILFSYNGLDALEHEDRMSVLRQVRELLADGGRFLFSSHSVAALPLDVERPRIDVRDPLRSAYRLYSAVPHARRLRRVNRELDLDTARSRGWIQLRDGDHSFDALYYYVQPAYQLRQLRDCGLEAEGVYALSGQAVDPDDPGRDPWLHYLCRAP